MEIKVRGRLGNDPETKTVGADNIPVAVFSLAHTPRSKKNGQWVDGDTQWFQVAHFGKRAEAIAKAAKKGDEVLVIGTLKLNKYTDRNGVEKSGMEITASEIGLVPKIDKTDGPRGTQPTGGWDTSW
jgi:single-strand DNA-binding protein